MSTDVQDMPPMAVDVKGKDLKKMWDEKQKQFGPEAGKKWFLANLKESFARKEISPGDFSLRDLATSLIEDGHEYWANIARRGEVLMEDAAYVDTSAFSNITGQLVFSAIQEGMQLDELIGDKLCTVLPSAFQNDEKIPGIAATADEFADELDEGIPYPLAGMSEEYIKIPRAQKRGIILGITREMVIADRTGLLIERGRSIGAGLAIRREKMILDVFIGGVNPYERKGIARNTYANVAGVSYFDNIVTDALVDHTDVQAAQILFSQMRDPNTGEPLGQRPTTFVCCPDLMWTARPVFRDTSVELIDRAAAAGQIGSRGVNRIPWNLELLENEWLTMRLLHHNGNGGLTTTTRDLAVAHWFIGRPRDAFVWKEIWPLTVTEAPNNSEAEFTADIWVRFKVSMKGVAGVREPRYMIRSDGTA